MKLKPKTSLVLTWLICVAVLAPTAVAQELDSAEFEFKYSGADILDGDELLNEWSVAGNPAVDGAELLDGASIELNERGNIVLTQTPDNRNFWLQQDSDTSPWEVDAGISWTLEVRAHLIGTETEDDVANNGFNLWAADGFQRGIATIREDSVRSFGRPGEIYSEQTNDDGFHTYRMSYDVDEDLYNLWRDAVLITSEGMPLQAETTNTRLIIGDCCTSANDLDPFIFEELEIEYIRYDMSGAFEPVPIVSIAGDCNGDGVLNAADLTCVGTIEERDAVLGELGTLPGDLDGIDGVGFADFLILSGNFGDASKTAYTDGNIDLTDGVAFPDFLALSGNFGKTGVEAAAVPEPSGLAIAIVGLAAISIRRRKTDQIRCSCRDFGN